MWPKRDSGTSPWTAGVDQCIDLVSRTWTSIPPPIPPQMYSMLPTTALVCRERAGGDSPVVGGIDHVRVWTLKTWSSLSRSALSPPPKMNSLKSIRSHVCPFRGDGGTPCRSGCDQVKACVVRSSTAAASLEPLAPIG